MPNAAHKNKRKTQGLSKPILYKSAFQAQYKPELRFYERFFSAVRKLTQFPHWKTDGLHITLYDPDKGYSVGVQHNHFVYAQDSHDIEQEGKFIDELLNILPSELQLNTFMRFGLRRWYLIPVGFSFESLVKILGLKLFSQDNKIKQILHRNLEDFTYLIVITEPPYKARISVSPVRKNEVEQNIPLDKEHHLPILDRAKSYIEFVNKYPDVAILIEVDFFQQMDDMSFEDAVLFSTTARSRVSNLVSDLTAYFLSDSVEG